jgi:hypothetical protein
LRLLIEGSACFGLCRRQVSKLRLSVEHQRFCRELLLHIFERGHTVRDDKGFPQVDLAVLEESRDIRRWILFDAEEYRVGGLGSRRGFVSQNSIVGFWVVTLSGDSKAPLKVEDSAIHA